MTSKLLILGIGNVLWADEGFGVRCIERLAENWEFDENVKLLDGGTQGLYLLPFLEDADILLVFDAIDYGLTPGTLKIVENDEVPRFMGVKTCTSLMGCNPKPAGIRFVTTCISLAWISSGDSP